jgi:hypothetical protein
MVGRARPGGPLIRGFARFWVDFIVGDDWRIAAGVTVVLAFGAVLAASEALSDAVVAPLVGLGIVCVVAFSLHQSDIER